MNPKKKSDSKSKSTKATQFAAKVVCTQPGFPIEISGDEQAEGDVHDLARFPIENPSPVMRIARSGNLLYANEGALVQLAGWKLELGKSVPKELYAPIREVFRTGKGETVELSCGERIFSIAIGSTPTGKDVNVYGRDITVRKRAEEALWESEGIFTQFMAASPVLVYIKDEKYRFHKLSKCFEDLFGKPISELIGKDLYDLLPPELAKIVFEDDKTVLKKGFSVSAEEKLGDRFFSSIKFPIHRDSGKPDYLGGFSVDITQRKLAEQALQEHELRIAQIVETVPDGVVMVDSSGKITFANHAAEIILGLEKDTITNRGYNDPAWKITSADGGVFPDEQQPFVRVMRTNKAVKGIEQAIEHPDGSRVILSINAVPLHDVHDNLVGMVAALTDITERKRMEEDIRNLSLTDELTGVYNRRGFILLAEQEIKLALRKKRTMLLFFGDVDTLKTINDTHGHAHGDLALKEISTVLKETFREADILARFGGDEFVILAVDASMESAKAMTSRIQTALEMCNQKRDLLYQLSFSIGAACYDPESPCTLDELLVQADGRMYQQKQTRKRSK